MTTTNKGLNQPAFDSLNWDVPLNQNAGWIDEALAGASSISVTGVSATPVVLTLSQYRPKAIIFTGTLSDNVTYRIPSGIGGEWVIVNSTTGAFTLTIDSAAGGPAAVIPQSETSMVYTNGGSSVGAVVLTGVTPSVQSALNGKQNVEPTLTALAAYNTNGILTQTAADTFTGRAITGTANQISVTNGNGVSGDPTISAVVASQAEAEAGTDTTKLMTALRVKQAIDALAPGVTTSSVLAATAGATAGAVGTYALLGVASVANSNYGDTRAGSDLYPAGFRSTTAFTTSTGAVSSAGQNSVRAGTWRCMGILASAAGSPPDDPTRYGATLWLRIS